jgi:hypothetical protein
MGGNCPGGYCPGGIVQGVLSRGVLSRGVLSGYRLNSTLTSWLGKPHSCEPVGEQLLNLPNDMDQAGTEKSDHHHEVYSTPMTSAIAGTKEPATAEITGTKESVITATGAIKPVITETCITGSSLGLDITPQLRPQRDRRSPLRFRKQSCLVSC